jgi:hypothetical protein
MKSRKPIAVTFAACLIAAGATAGIAQSATGKKHQTRKSTESGALAGKAGMPPGGGPMGPGGPGGAGAPGSVHSVSVVLNKAGTAYISQTTDSGTVKSVDPSAGTITITEGTSSVTYGTPTLTIP